MEVIPVINCPDATSVRERLAHLSVFHEPVGWIHLDVTDGVFSKHETWHDPVAWPGLGSTFSLEVHLMVKNPEDYIGPWIAAGAKRIIVHAEVVSPDSASAIIAIARNHGVEIMLAMEPETQLDAEQGLLALFKSVQILAVHPGAGGQELMPSVIEKIFALRHERPDVIIEVDGGINPQTARLAKEAGADIITSDHYIFSASDPERAYHELKNIS